MTGVRLDKWLWAARFFKTRSLAPRACDLGRVERNGLRVKPAHDVHVGDQLKIENDAGCFVLDVLALSDVRGPAAVAQTLYSETAASKELRLKTAQERKAMALFEGPRMGRPSKRNRRDVDRFRGRR
jgi:ribosome-associated heat shock protein Hsp15